ncbi:hypothetical protein N7495_001927 [Penicillium taxi]|uniref:uncharacterized protein n=1 Tax=Penicillium taxi TaxID=168475 RepID=UPI0025452697|nr:uncharacterized protein N7495_001927 [Penicillium taxi]KAJ5909245.1 hypothetical protein N7495_001927 [Penicillium taxi]
MRADAERRMSLLKEPVKGVNALLDDLHDLNILNDEGMNLDQFQAWFRKNPENLFESMVSIINQFRETKETSDEVVLRLQEENTTLKNAIEFSRSEITDLEASLLRVARYKSPDLRRDETPGTKTLESTRARGGKRTAKLCDPPLFTGADARH